jgi:hypothetical protein
LANAAIALRFRIATTYDWWPSKMVVPDGSYLVVERRDLASHGSFLFRSASLTSSRCRGERSNGAHERLPSL